jgi:hypothetical protein
MRYENQEYQRHDLVAYGSMPVWVQAWHLELLVKVFGA